MKQNPVGRLGPIPNPANIISQIAAKGQLHQVCSQYSAKMARSVMSTWPLFAGSGFMSLQPHQKGAVQPDSSQWAAKRAKSRESTIPILSRFGPEHCAGAPAHTIEVGIARSFPVPDEIGTAVTVFVP